MQQIQCPTLVLKNGTLATMTEDGSYGLMENSSLVVKKEYIAWIGAASELPSEYQSAEAVDLQGDLVTPGLIDCHTHIVHAGNRAKEFELRLNGASYEEVARAGGGIISTVSATRKATQEELVVSALPRLDALIAEGVCTIEIKSGYGLDRETEVNMLRAARELEQIRPIRVKTSFLGAHALPQEYKKRPDAYLEEICIPTLHAAHAEGLIDAVDGFCESIAFAPVQIERLFEESIALGLPVKLHAEQLSNTGGTELLARFNGLSADHIEYANEQDVVALKNAGAIAVLLPGAYYTLRETQLPPVHLLRKHGVPIAVATDCNPGSSPLASILLTMNMACTLFRLTPTEALLATTRNAAKALGHDEFGEIRVGHRADLCIWDVKHPAELTYRIGFNPLKHRIFGGAI